VKLALIDAIGPFFRGYDKRRINWSKIHFAHLATRGPAFAAQWDRIQADFTSFTGQVAALGYNAITLDDLPHLADHPWFEPELRERSAVLREEFRQLFDIARSRGLQVFITCDYLTSTAAIDARLKGDPEASCVWFRDLLDRFFAEFPEVAGVILRIGESDGHDIVDPLRSRLTVRTAKQVRQLLDDILPTSSSTDVSWSSAPGRWARISSAT
jgi:hypothetical protein